MLETVARYNRAYRKLYEHVLGNETWDYPTLCVCHPGFIAAVQRLREMAECDGLTKESKSESTT